MILGENRIFSKIKIICIIGVLFFVSFTSMIGAGDQIQQVNQNDYIFDYDYASENEIIIDFKLPKLTQTNIQTSLGEFTLFEIPNSGFIGEIGQPQTPMMSRILAVPTNQVSFEIIDTKTSEKQLDNKLHPLQNPQTDSEVSINNEFVIDETSYEQNIEYPGKIIDITTTGKIRDIPFIKIGFYPIQYNPTKNKIKIYDEIQIKITYNTINSVLVESEYTKKPFYNYYQNIFSNWNGFIKNTNIKEKPITKDNGCDYLIITDDSYYSQVKPLADWKHKQGYMTKIANISETGSTSSQIQSYIQNAYDSWTPQPSYVLLMGDSEQVPTTYVSYTPTDLYYVTVDGSDYYPDLFIGRIPADDTTEAEVMVQKILNYEKNPPTLESFYENFVVAAYFQDNEPNGYESRRFVRTSEEVRDYLISIDYIGERIYVTDSYVNPTNYNDGDYGNGEPLPPELLRPTFAWDGDKDDIINAIEQGIFILNHRDHGMTSGWGDPYFTIDDFVLFANGELLPVVFSLNCQSGGFASAECFCEEFLRKDDGGVVAAFGASSTSYSGYNDYLCRGFYDAIWPDFDTDIGDNNKLTNLGEVLNYGKTYMADTWGDPWDLEETTFELFHLFGDPALDIFTELPKNLAVSYVFINNEVKITVTGEGSPIEGALVCVSQEDGLYQSGLTDTSGIVYLDITDANPEEELSLVATAHNYLYKEMSFSLNQKPNKPDAPTGPNQGKPNTEYMFTATTTDPDSDRILYNFSWGDGTYSGWVGPFDSGGLGYARHIWNGNGSYEVKVKAKDTKGEETEWSDPQEISMPLGKSYNYNILSFILERFPKAFPIIRLLLNL